MFFLKILAATVMICHRIWCRFRMLMLRPAFRSYGRHFIFDPDGHYTFKTIEVGDDVSIGSRAVLMAANSRIIIGSKVMFGPGVTVLGGDHNTSSIGQYMYDVKDKRREDDQDVIIEDDVWIGAGAIILKGVRLGRGAVVAAGAIVNKPVLPYTIVGGVPAEVISMRFGEIETILHHEKALYPPKKRLSEEFLETVLAHGQ
jgi:acetyltransferase-like isoleucine patch superfamily enzyme